MKNNKKVYKPTNSKESWIVRIRKGGGTIFVDPAPMSKPLEDWINTIGRFFRK